MNIFHFNSYVKALFFILLSLNIVCTSIENNNFHYIESVSNNFEEISEDLYFLKEGVDKIEIQSIYPDNAVKAKCFYLDKKTYSVWELYSLKKDDADKETKTSDNATIQIARTSVLKRPDCKSPGCWRQSHYLQRSYPKCMISKILTR